jgi:hypothetical protein
MQQKHLNSLKNNSTTLKILKLRLTFFILLHLLFGLPAVGQMSGDYRSTNTGAAVSPYYWNLNTSWEYYNGATWIPATNYPGEISGIGVVLIRTGDIINIGSGGISTKSMGTIIISGSLILTVVNSGANGIDFFFDTQTIIVTPLSGTIKFVNKVNLKLPPNATLQVTKDTSQNPAYYGLVGDCNHNQNIYIGTDVYAYCNGGGSTGLTFLLVISEGGTPNAIATSNSPVCQGGPINLFGSYSGVQGATASYSWSIVNPMGVITTTTVQNPMISSAISGTYVITLTYSTTYNGILYSNSETIAVLVNALPTITAQPINQLDCQGNIVSFNVVASGGGLAYVWQRKLPAEASFSAIPVDTNVSYPTPDKIRLQNVGSSLSTNGTQYQVVVSNGTCTVNSSVATLSVNEITGVSPTATTVTQCYGTNYSYTASTSYPSNVVSYQWKSSVTSGVWNDVVNGPHFSGATTATLNIINGTPTESAGYRVYITFNSSGADCNVTSASRTRILTFLPLLLTPATVITQPTCSLATGTITVTIQSPSDTYSFDNGLSYQASNIKSGLATGNRNVIIKNSSGCVSVATEASIDVQPATLVQPILSVATQPTCVVATGSVVLSGLPTGIWTVTQSRDSSQTTGIGTSITIPGLASGFYTYVVSIGSCTSVDSAGVEIYATTNTWNMDSGGGSWANTLTSTQAITFNGDYNSTGDLFACSCRVDSGAVVINSGHILKITNEISVSGGGSLTFEKNASLGQINETAANYGNILYKRTTSTLNNNYDFVYWSSPVQDQKIGTIWMASNWADTFYNFNPAGNSWARTYEANKMIPGKGYISRARDGQSGVDYADVTSPPFTVGGTWTAKFFGVPNNGTITVTDCVAGRDCLLGNPYPSALDADLFLAENSAVLEGTLYFWTHTTPMTNNAYNSNDYASYNFSGSVATARGNLVNGVPNDNKKPTGKIAAGQSFFATAKGTANVIFNNTMRVGAEGAPLDNNQFFRTSNTKAKTANSIEKHRVWLNVSNTQGAFKQTLVGYVTDATNDYDSRFDGESFGGNTYVDFYSINQGKNFTIQGRALPFDQNDTVPLGFKTTIEGSFTIDIDEVDGLLTNQAVYLEDKVTNTVSNLKNGNYTFTTAKGTFNDRFVLRYTDTDTTLSIDDTDQEDGILVFYSNNYKTLIIKNKVMDSTVNSVALFNMAGQNIEKWDVKDSGQTNIQIPIKNIPSGIYIVKVKTTKGESSKKIIVN